jgi:mono/diheme cytochrome c family protein
MNKIVIAAITAFFVATGCSGGEKKSENKQTTEQKAEDSDGLTDFQMKNGIGPVIEPVSIGEIDEELAEQGEQIFQTKCSACHKLAERYVGPPLGDVLNKRTPAYVMNMTLNPDQMLKEHPEAKKLLAEYMTPMPNQNITREEARAIVEYLTSASQEAGSGETGN